MKKTLLIGVMVLLSAVTTCFADSAPGAYTQIAPETNIYSEYYPNNQSAFKGTIIFENGGGCDIDEWQVTTDKQISLFNYARTLGAVFVYARPGIGNSSPDYRISATSPITAEYTVNNLLQVLKQRNVKPPYIIVAHSYGGVFAQYFVRKYPGLVAGVLYMDVTVSDPKSFVNFYSKQIELAKAHSSKWMYKNDSSVADTAYQALGYPVSMEQINSLPPISPAIPIIVLEASASNSIIPNWHQRQQALASQTSNSKLVVVDCGHYIMQDKPEICCQQLLELVNRIKQ
ncbi:MAG: alpha/beta hydrolase [Negativicutes bacterium]